MGWDLTSIGIMVRGFELPLPCSPSGMLREGKGMGLVSILSAGADLVGNGFSFSPLGETGEGLGWGWSHGRERPRYWYEAD